MTSQQRVFLSIRNGTLGLHIDQFTTEDLNSFLPTLIYQFFTNTEAGSETNSQNEHQLVSNIVFVLKRCFYCFRMPSGHALLIVRPETMFICYVI